MDKKTLIELMKGSILTSLDIETTGIGDSESIIELGLIQLVEGEVRVVNGKKCEVEVIFGGGKSCQRALETHGITDESRIGKKTFAQKAQFVRNILTSKIKDSSGSYLNIIISGHNVKKFDLGKFIIPQCKNAGFPIGEKGETIYVADTLDLARKYIQSPDYKLETLCKVCGFKHGGHRGLGDTRSSLNVLIECLSRSKASNIIEICEKLNV